MQSCGSSPERSEGRGKIKKVRVQQCVWTLQIVLSVALLAGLAAAPVRAQNTSQAAAGAKPAAESHAAAAAQSASGAPVASAGSTQAATPPGKVVMRVGDTPVTAADIEDVVKTLPQPYQRAIAVQGLKQVGDVFALRLALYQKALSEGLDQTPEFKKQLERERLLMLASREYQTIRSAVKVTPDEVDQYYKQHAGEYDLVQIRRVMVRKKAAGQPASVPGLPDAQAKAKAEAIRQALASGQEAAKVADEFKMPDVVFFDTKPEPVHRGQLPGPLDHAAWTLKDGAVSETEDNPGNVYFIQVVKHEQQPEQDVAREIQSRLSEEKFQQALKDMREQAKIWYDPDYFAAPKPAAPAAPAAAPESKTPPEPKKH